MGEHFDVHWASLARLRSRGGRAAFIARNLLRTGLAVFGGGLLVEAAGAFGYGDSDQRVNALAVLHDVGVVLGPLGIVLSMAGAITSIGVALAAVAAIAFVVGGLIFGYRRRSALLS
jgi:hypothetical protein